MGVITKMSQLIHDNMNEEKEDMEDTLAENFPQLFWVCRDFHYDLEEGQTPS
jgi:hypothetical protein